MKLASADRHADLYPDRHLNVFVPYQAHDLDYNVTRALISTLRWSKPELTQAFLAELAGVEAEGQGWHYDLQSCDYEDFDPGAVERQVVLGISRRGELATRLPSLDDGELSAGLLHLLRSPVHYQHKLEEVRRVLARPDLDDDDIAVLHHTLEELDDGCLPDGWVFSPDAGVCVLLECKLTQLLDLSQLQRYGDVYFGKAPSADEVVLKTWADVGAFFAQHRGDDDARTAFLCGQLCDYLDLLGLSAFEGFKPYDFDPDAAQDALPKFLAFSRKLHAQAADRGLPLGDVVPSPTGTRVGFSDAGTLGELKLDLREEGIRLELRLGDGVTGEHPGRAALDVLLERWQDGELNPLAEAEVPALDVRIERLRSDAADGEAFVELETHSGALEAGDFGEVLEDLRLQHPLQENARGAAGTYRRGALSIGRLIPRADALGGDAGLMEQALTTVQGLLTVARAFAAEPATTEAEA
jgi:hypothetical protein